MRIALSSPDEPRSRLVVQPLVAHRPPLSSGEQAVWFRQWRAAGAALLEQKAAALRALTDAEARATSEILLALAAESYRAPARETGSGLVEQQRRFHADRAEARRGGEPA